MWYAFLYFPQDEILCHTKEMTKDLHHIKIKYDEGVEQRTLLQLQRRDVALVMP